MKRVCPECDSDLFHRDGSSTWECPNPRCYVAHVRIERIKNAFNKYKIGQVIYVAVL